MSKQEIDERENIVKQLIQKFNNNLRNTNPWDHNKGYGGFGSPSYQQRPSARNRMHTTDQDFYGSPFGGRKNAFQPSNNFFGGFF